MYPIYSSLRMKVLSLLLTRLRTVQVQLTWRIKNIQETPSSRSRMSLEYIEQPQLCNFLLPSDLIKFILMRKQMLTYLLKKLIQLINNSRKAAYLDRLIFGDQQEILLSLMVILISTFMCQVATFLIAKTNRIFIPNSFVQSFTIYLECQFPLRLI